MYIMHVALGGCLKAPPVTYGITEDTGGHITYVLGAATAQGRRAETDRVEIVTRAFDAPHLGAVHARAEEPVAPKVVIRRIRSARAEYLCKDALAAELPSLRAAFLGLLDAQARTGRLPDVIHAHFADAAELAAAAKAAFGIPFLYTPHSLAAGKAHAPADGAHARRLGREAAAIATADAIVVSSRDEAERQLVDYDPDAAGRTWRVNPGVSLPPSRGTGAAEALLRAHLAEPERPFLLAIARPVAKKNLAALLRAYAASAGLRARANLVILAGQARTLAPDEAEAGAVRAELRALAAGSGLAGRVALPAEHTPGEVTGLYRLAARQGGVFVNPAVHEPFGLTVVEAASAGLPVVATRDGGPADILRTIGHGLTVDPRDDAAIAAACLRLLSDGGLHARYAAAARANHHAYSWTAWAGEVAQILRRLRAPQPRPAAAPTLLCAFDIDGTLTGCATGAAAFADWAQGCAARRQVLAIATGRPVSEARRVLARHALPIPRTLITSVGSEIWHDGTLDAGYAAAISDGWERDAIVDMGRRLGWTAQARYEQRRWKLSYLGTAADAASIRQALARRGLAAHVVASHGRLIDILPARAGKAAAIAHLARRLGLTPERCLSAGDSGNDADMLAATGRAIVVANALPELRLRDRPGLYRARGRHASGVMEGLQALGAAPALSVAGE